MTTKSAPARPNLQADPRSLAQQFYSKEEVAALLHVTVSTLWRWAQLGVGPTRIVIGRRVLYSRAAVDLYIEHEQRKNGRAS